MKRRTTNLLSLAALTIAVSLVLSAAPALAQRGGGVKTDSRILYHNGPVLQGTSDVYLIWYGNWGGNTTPSILIDLIINLGWSPYFMINSLYPDASGVGPSGGLVYGGSINDSYSHGSTLTESDIQGIVADSIATHQLPQDPLGIYIVIGSADVTDIHSDGTTTFCTPPFAPPLHGSSSFGGSQFRYAFIGSAARCPTTAALQFNGGALPSPNGNYAADAMASTMAHALAAIVTNPTGTGWFDRYGLENAAKCQGTFGETYLTPYNGARANMRLGQRDFLIQQNWVNAPRKGYCGLSNP